MTAYYLDNILKRRDITLLTKVCIVKVVIFPVVLYRCENWTIKKPEHWRIDAFKLWCWRRLLGVPWTTRRAKQSILKEINPEYSLEGLMLKLKLQYFGHVMWSTNPLEENPGARKDWGQEENGATENEMVGWHHWLNGHMSLSKLWEMVNDREAWHAAVYRIAEWDTT